MGVSAEKREFLSVAVLVTAASFALKGLTLAVSVLLSYRYGASARADALIMAVEIPLLLAMVFTATADGSVIPQYNRLLATRGRDAADRMFSRVLNLVAPIGLVIALLLFLFPEACARIAAAGFTGEQLTETIRLNRVFSCLGLLNLLGCFFATYVTLHKRVIYRSIFIVTPNIFVVASLLLFPDPYLRVLPWAYVAGYAAAAGVATLGAWRGGYRHRCFPDAKEDFRRYLYVATPLLMATSLGQLNVFVVRFFASRMEVGGVSAFSYAVRLTALFDQFVMVGLGVAILPLLSRLGVNAEDKPRFNATAALVCKLLAMGLLPAAVGVWLTAPDLVRVVYMRGQFGEESARTVAGVLGVLAPNILFVSLTVAMEKIFQSREDTRTPLAIHAGGMAFYFAAIYPFSQHFGLHGIAMVSVITHGLTVTVYWHVLRRRFGWDHRVFGWREAARLAVAVSAMAAVVLLVRPWLPDSPWWRLAGCAATGAAVYAGALRLLMPAEVKYMQATLRSARGRRGRADQTDDDSPPDRRDQAPPADG